MGKSCRQSQTGRASGNLAGRATRSVKATPGSGVVRSVYWGAKRRRGHFRRRMRAAPEATLILMGDRCAFKTQTPNQSNTRLYGVRQRDDKNETPDRQQSKGGKKICILSQRGSIG